MFSGVLVGRLGQDPELRSTSGGTSIASVGVPFEVYNKGEKKTHWVNVKVWGKRGESLAEHAKKGDTIAFSGKVEFEEWTGKDGTEQKKLALNASDWQFVGGGRSNREGGDESPAGDVPF